MISSFPHKKSRALSGLIALVALIDCAITGSWVAALIAIAFGVIDTNADLAIEAWEYTHQVDRPVEDL